MKKKDKTIKNCEIKPYNDVCARDVIAIDFDQTIVSNPSLFYRIMNTCVDKTSILKMLKKVSKEHKAVLFDLKKKYKKRVFNSLFGFLNPDKYVEIDKAVECINKLSQNYAIFLVTSRPVKPDFFKYLLAKNIENLGINVDYVVASCADKQSFCKMINAKFFIDNNINYCVKISENSDTKAICFNNENIGKNEKILHLGQWENVYNFIEYINPMLETADKPYATWGVRQEYKRKISPKLLDYELLNVKNLDNLKENTK